MLVGVLFTSCSAFAQVDVTTLQWSTCGSSCPDAPEVSAFGNTVTVGVDGRGENTYQNTSKHIASTLLPPSSGYTITFSYDLSTWDSYNAVGTPNPPFNGGTGLWDSFSVSVSSQPFWLLTLTDPLSTTQIPGLGFLWGGSSYGDLSLETNSGQKTITVQGNPQGNNYLNVGLDTATLPEADMNFPSWGTFSFSEIKLNCSSHALSVLLFKQCNSAWGSDSYDHIDSTICDDGCALSSMAMILSYYGFSPDPGSLNTWLNMQFDDTNGNGKLDPSEKTYGYTRDGLVNFAEVGPYTGNKLEYLGPSSKASDLDADLCSGKPAILQEPGHFIVATGKTATSYTINDPGYSRTTLDAYDNKFVSVRRFSKPGSGAFILYVPANIEALVVDPLGRKLGYVNGAIVNEIIGASYVDEMIVPPNGAPSTANVHVLSIPSPPEGVYNLIFIGTIGGRALVDLYRYNNKNLPQDMTTFNINVSEGSAVSQVTTYSTRAGDLNSDGFVNEKDQAIVQASMGAHLGGPHYNPVADANGDGIVNVIDFAIASGIQVIAVPVDVHPGTGANDINVRAKGVVPVAILSTDSFDAPTAVDVSTIQFGPNGAPVARDRGHIEDVNGDGRLDLVFQFDTQATGIACGDTVVSLWGQTVSGVLIQGIDSIHTVGCRQ